MDWQLVAIALTLSVYGIAIVYSAGQTDVLTGVARLWRSQILWFCLALCTAYVMSRVSVRLLDWLTWPFYVFMCLVLVLLLFVGKGAGTAASTKSWLAIGGFPIRPPPGGAKSSLAIALAKGLAVLGGAAKGPPALCAPAPPLRHPG